MRVGFFGSPPFATPILAALAASRFSPVVVVTQPEREAGRGRKVVASAVAELAERHGIALERPPSARDAAFKGRLRERAVDVFLVASYGELLDRELLAIPPRGALNVHGSLLPRWRGASPVQAAILAGDARTGVTIQRMVQKLDAGDVLLERATAIGADETGGELAARLAVLGAEAALDALALVADGADRYKPQDEAAVTHCRKLGKAAGELDWTRASVELARAVRAYEPWPGARAHLDDGRELIVRRARAVPAARLAPGDLDAESAAAGRVLVGTSDGALELLEVQPEGRRALAAAEWLRGARLAPTARFVVAPVRS